MLWTGMHSDPLAYFITFRTHGTWHPGDRRGSTSRSPDDHGRKSRSENNALNNASRQTSSPVYLSDEERTVVERAVRGVCEHRGWALVAINVRSNHLHCVVVSDRAPERVMNDFKSWSTRRLREAGYHADTEKVWARHGSTRYLFKSFEVEYAEWYTREAQDGERFAPVEATDP